MGLYRPTFSRKKPNGTPYKYTSRNWSYAFKNPRTGLRVTGSTGTNPIQDGAVRGIIAGAISAILIFISDKTDILTDGDIVTLAPVVVAVAMLRVGVFDRYLRPLY